MSIDAALNAMLRQSEEQLLLQAIRNDADALRELLHDEFIEFGSSGRIFDKQAIIDAVKNEPLVSRSIENFKADLLAPGVALLTYRISRQSDAGESIRTNRSSIWMLVGNRWQMRFHQGTVSSREY
jgi:hypothetical protein